LLRIFPKELLNRINPKIIAEFYQRRPTKRPTQGGREASKNEEEDGGKAKKGAEGKLIDDE